MVTKFFRFGHTDICIKMPDEMKYPANFEKFRVEETDKCIQYTLTFAEDINQIAKDLLNKKRNGFCEVVRENLHVFYMNREVPGTSGEMECLSGDSAMKPMDELCECRFIIFAGAGKPYGISMQRDKFHYQVWVDQEICEMLAFDTIFTSLFSLEKHVIRDGSLILHSAYMCWNDSAVLFSAPSETGKSTQANLWEKYRHTYTVNGDRSLLVRDENGWMAYGWPVCGSSEICHNEVHPVHSIVMLRQAKENRIYRINGLRALREVMEQITINSWNREFQMKAMDQLELLLREVPVYCLECDISEEAVACLEKELTAG